MTRERIRPRPCAGSLSAQVLALACRDVGEDKRMRGATSNDELDAWCKDLADKLSTYGDLEAAHARIAELEAALVPKVQIGEDDVAEVARPWTADELLLAADDAAKARIAELEAKPRTLDVAVTINAAEVRAMIEKHVELAADGEALYESVLRGMRLDDAGPGADLTDELDTLTRLRCAVHRTTAMEAQLVDLLALELEFVRMLRAGGVLPADDPPPATTDLLALVRSMRS